MNQSDFSGGLNMFKDASGILEKEYVFGVNLRPRSGNLAPIKLPEKLSTPAGKKQGLYTVGSLLVAFIEGRAYYKLFTSTTWTQIANFQMSADVDYIYGCLVPSSNRLFRKPSSTTDISAGVALTIDQVGIPTPSCFVCQDGINQPWLIFSDGTARLAQTYAQWTTTSREYVPIGKNMAWIDGILYIVASDGKSIYRSVTGRPLDFVVNITSNGAKGGDASTVSFAVDFNTITCIADTNSGAFFISTTNSCYLVTPDYTNTIFGEPQFTQAPVMNTGVVNQFSFTETLGDYAFVDFEGVKSFNAVQQLKFKGRNSNFSLKFSAIFDLPDNQKILQSTSAVARYDNCLFFSLNSNLGFLILVFDELLGVPVSFDITSCIKVKQFAVLSSSDVALLYAMTDTDIYEYYGSDNYAEATVRVRDWLCDMSTNSQAAGMERNINRHRSSNLRLVFGETKSGVVYAQEFVDGRMSYSQQDKNIIAREIGLLVPLAFPIIIQELNVDDVTFVFDRCKDGIKIGYTFRWTNGSKLEGYELKTNINSSDVGTTS